MLEDMLEEEPGFGFVACDGQEATLALVHGTTVDILHRKMTSGTKNRTRRGGMSSNRYARLRNTDEAAFVLRICERMTALFMTKDMPPKASVHGIVLCGTAELKRMVATSADLPKPLAEKVIAVVDTEHAGETGVREAMVKSAQARSTTSHARESELIETFLDTLARDPRSVSYGAKAVAEAIAAGAVATLLLGTQAATTKPPKGQAAESYEAWAVVACAEMGSEVVATPGITHASAQFCTSFGGIAAVLRFPLDPLDEDDEEEDDDENDDEKKQDEAQQEPAARASDEQEPDKKKGAQKQKPAVPKTFKSKASTASPKTAKMSNAVSTALPVCSTGSNQPRAIQPPPGLGRLSPAVDNWEQLSDDDELTVTTFVGNAARASAAPTVAPSAAAPMHLNPTAHVFMPTFFCAARIQP
eukprot:m.21140 g.21140  ORF g.21140 m.21140 type:complete len:416 (-) comp6344_c0_seq1:104-1351(-)